MKESFKLIDGNEIPAIGFGTWQTPDGATAVESVRTAIEAGYKHIDTAAVYKNEKGVGQGIKDSGIKREELFVTSKVWNTHRGHDATLRAFDKTMSDLQLDYLDLYLIHWPASAHQYDNWREINADTFLTMAQLQREGRIKSIGVSNFYSHHLEALIEDTGIVPVIDQIEYHPGFMQTSVVDTCRKHDIVVEAWSPLGTGRMLNNKQLMDIAAKYGVSVAQLCIRWVIQHDILPLPKSITPSRIKENLQVDFTISAEDMAFIDSMEECGWSGLNSDEINF